MQDFCGYLPLCQLSKLCRYHVHITGFFVVSKALVYSRKHNLWPNNWNWSYHNFFWRFILADLLETSPGFRC